MLCVKPVTIDGFTYLIFMGEKSEADVCNGYLLATDANVATNPFSLTTSQAWEIGLAMLGCFVVAFIFRFIAGFINSMANEANSVS